MTNNTKDISTIKTARIAGILFISATVLSILSSSILLPIINTPDYLGKISANENRILIGSLIHIISAFACAGIAISLYPVLRKYNEGLALGSVGFRIAEMMFYVFDSIFVLSLLPLCQEFLKAGMPRASYFQTLANSLLSMRDWSILLAIITFGLTSGILVMFNVLIMMSPIFIALNIPIFLQEMVMASWMILKGFNPSVIASASAKVDRN